MPKKIEAYKTEDGKIFEDKLTATNHEKEIKIKAGLNYLCRQYGYYDMHNDDIANMLFEHSEEFHQALQGVLEIPPEKPQEPKKGRLT